MFDSLVKILVDQHLNDGLFCVFLIFSDEFVAIIDFLTEKLWNLAGKTQHSFISLLACQLLQVDFLNLYLSFFRCSELRNFNMNADGSLESVHNLEKWVIVWMFFLAFFTDIIIFAKYAHVARSTDWKSIANVAFSIMRSEIIFDKLFLFWNMLTNFLWEVWSNFLLTYGFENLNWVLFLVLIFYGKLFR